MQNKVMKIKDYEDGDSFWRVACDCSSPEHDVSLWFDASSTDIEYGSINLNLSMEIGIYDNYSYWADKWWYPLNRAYRSVLWRIGVAAKVLFTGRYTMQGDVVLDLDGVKAMQFALEEGIKHARNNP